MESLVSQMRAFLATIVIGMTAGVFYDYYRVARRIFRLKKTGTCLGDAIFWLITTAVVFLMLLWGNWGEMRFYVLIGLTLGALLYFRLFSSHVRYLIVFKFYVFQKAWGLFVKAMSFLLMVILFPFRLLFLVLSYPLCFIKSLFIRAGKKLKAVFYHLAGRRVERGVAGIKLKVAGLAFWKNKKE